MIPSNDISLFLELRIEEWTQTGHALSQLSELSVIEMSDCDSADELCACHPVPRSLLEGLELKFTK